MITYAEKPTQTQSDRYSTEERERRREVRMYKKGLLEELEEFQKWKEESQRDPIWDKPFPQ